MTTVMHVCLVHRRQITTRLLRFAFLLALAATPLPAEVLVETGFGGDSTEGLPSGWADDSGSRFTPVYKAVTEKKEEAEEDTFLRIEHGEAETLALYTELPQHEAESSFTVSLKVRSENKQSLRLSIRTRLSPHTYLAESELRLAEDWGEITVEMPNVPAAGERIELALELSGPAVFDIATLRLERHSRSSIVHHLLIENADVTGANLLRLTRFPLGLQTGMSIDRTNCDLDEITIEPDPDTIGPSGSPALRISSEKPFVLYLPPFDPVLKFDLHRAAFSVRGTGEGRFFVMTEGETLAEEAFKANSGRWSRVEGRFHPSATAAVHSLRLEGSGTLWIDALQVSHGDQETPYAAKGEAEVALALPEGDASPARIHFSDETPHIRYAVTGNSAGGTLRGRLHNLYGDEAELPPVFLSDEFLQEGTWKSDLFPDRALGSFRLEAWVENKKGEVVSPYYELVYHRLQRPRFWGEDSPGSFFGVHTNPTRRHLLMAKAVGINWVRLHDAGLPSIGWYHLEREKGKWSFFDHEIERYRRYQLQILGSLSTAPEWASRITSPQDPYFDRFYQPKDFDQFSEYAEVVAKRYQNSIRHYDVWNEPWHQNYWAVDWNADSPGRGYTTSEDPVGDYVRLKKKAHEGVKSVDEEIKVVGVNTIASDSENHWTQGIVNNSGLEASDIFGYHQYVNEAGGYAGDTIEVGTPKPSRRSERSLRKSPCRLSGLRRAPPGAT